MIAKSAAALGAGILTLLSVATYAQDPATSGAGTAVVLDDATIDWIEKSDVAALREGVIEKMELKLGDPALKDAVIGNLHRESARLTVAKAQTQAASIGAIEKAVATKNVALAVVAINKRLNERKPGMVSKEEMAKAEGELNVAAASEHEASENQAVARAELALAKQVHEEHTIKSPFDGVIIKRYKDPGESVRAGEPVVFIGKLARLCANAYVPFKHAFKVKEGQVVEIRPKLEGADVSKEDLDGMVVRGKITFVDPQIQANVSPERRIRAEFDNPEFKVLPGMKVQLIIYVNNDVAARIPEPRAR